MSTPTAKTWNPCHDYRPWFTGSAFASVPGLEVVGVYLDFQGTPLFTRDAVHAWGVHRIRMFDRRDGVFTDQCTTCGKRDDEAPEFDIRPLTLEYGATRLTGETDNTGEADFEELGVYRVGEEPPSALALSVVLYLRERAERAHARALAELEGKGAANA